MTPTTLAASVPEAASARSPARVVLAEAEARADFHRSISAVGAFTLSGTILDLSARLKAYERPQR